MDNAVSAMNRMISSLEKTRVSPAQRSWDDTDIYLQNSPSDEAIETTRININAKASVHRLVTVCLNFPCPHQPSPLQQYARHNTCITCQAYLCCAGGAWKKLRAVFEPACGGLQLIGPESGRISRGQQISAHASFPGMVSDQSVSRDYSPNSA